MIGNIIDSFFKINSLEFDNLTRLSLKISKVRELMDRRENFLVAKGKVKEYEYIGVRQEKLIYSLFPLIQRKEELKNVDWVYKKLIDKLDLLNNEQHLISKSKTNQYLSAIREAPPLDYFHDLRKYKG